ncbi:MAG TPA: hypothetical protein VFZ00_01545 [Solirubrobacter sp.]|nr:hypothetical protein [Solirubrobacter sp.]
MTVAVEAVRAERVSYELHHDQLEETYEIRRVEVVGCFDSREAARQHMIDTTEERLARDGFMTTYGVIHAVLLGTSDAENIRSEPLRLLLAIAERGGSVEGASRELGTAFGSSEVQIRRSALELTAAGLTENRSKRGVGMRLALTERGREVGAAMLGAIAEGLAAVRSGSPTDGAS